MQHFSSRHVNCFQIQKLSISASKLSSKAPSQLASKVVSKVGSKIESSDMSSVKAWIALEHYLTSLWKRSSRRPSPPRVAAYLGTKGVIRRCSTIPDEGASTSGSFRSESGKETSSNPKSSSLDTSQSEGDKICESDKIGAEERPPKIRIVQPSIDEINFKTEVPLTNQKKVSLNPFQTNSPPVQSVQYTAMTPTTPTLPRMMTPTLTKKSTTSILKKSPVTNSPVIQRFSKIEFSKNSSLPNVNKSNSNSSLNINQFRSHFRTYLRSYIRSYYRSYFWSNSRPKSTLDHMWPQKSIHFSKPFKTNRQAVNRLLSVLKVQFALLRR